MRNKHHKQEQTRNMQENKQEKAGQQAFTKQEKARTRGRYWLGVSVMCGAGGEDLSWLILLI